MPYGHHCNPFDNFIKLSLKWEVYEGKDFFGINNISYKILVNNMMELIKVILASLIKSLILLVFVLIYYPINGQGIGSTISFKYYSSQSDRNLLEIKLIKGSDSSDLILKKFVAKDYKYSEEYEILTYDEIHAKSKIEIEKFGNIWNKAIEIKLENLITDSLVGKDGITTYFSFGDGGTKFNIQIIGLDSTNSDKSFILTIKDLFDIAGIDFCKYYDCRSTTE